MQARRLTRVLTYEARGPVAWLALDRPEKLNAQPQTFWGELRELMARVGRDDAVRVAVFHGVGKAFSVGGDIEGFGELAGAAQRRAYVADAMAAFQAVENLSKPTIAAVHGYALGGGCELTLVCDIVVADETARFGMPETAVGLFPGLGVVRGRTQVNLHTLKYMILTGEQLNAQDARLAGLVNVVVPEGQHLAEAERLAELIAKRSPLAAATAKAILGRGSFEGYAPAIDAVAMLQGSEDHAEGIAAFAARRPAAFKGR
jgi:enoyl-CoA hydratase/carnithine racemase